MSQNTPDKNQAAEERIKETKHFVLQVRAATRKKYPSEEKLRVVLEGFTSQRLLFPKCSQFRHRIFTGMFT